MVKKHMFSDGSAWDLLETIRRNMEAEISTLSAANIAGRTDEQLVAYFSDKYSGEVPHLADPPYATDQRPSQPNDEV